MTEPAAAGLPADTGGAAPADGAGPGRVSTGAAYLLVLVLAVQNAVWGTFLLPLRVGGTLVPVSLLLAGGGTALLGVAGARVLGRRSGAVAPGLLWVVLALMAGSRRAEGDLLITGGETGGLATLGLAFLAVGAVGAAAGYGLSPVTPRQPRPVAPTGSTASTSPERQTGR